MGLLSSILRGFLPKKGRSRRRKRARAVQGEDGAFRPSDAGGVKICVASLFGSGGKEASERIAGMLTRVDAMQTFRLNKALKQNLRLGLLERLLAAVEEGSGWLRDEDADLLIWGEMEDMGTVARLRFTTRGGSGDGVPGTFGLADTLDLPVPWPDDAGDIVRAVAIAAALPVTRGPRQDLAERLKKMLPSAAKAAGALPEELPEGNRAMVHSALGNAFATSFRFGDKKALAGAVAEYGAAEKLAPADEFVVEWALVQTHLGAVLEADARGRKDPAALEAAIARYQAVCDALGRDSNGYDWALAQVRRGMALYRLAALVPEKTAAHLKEAAAAFEEALTVYDRAIMPYRWAEVMNHYGVAQMALGGYGSGNAMLQQSISTFRKVMEVHKRENAPELWAQTANNLGAACFALAKRTGEEYLLQEAAANFLGAVQLYRKIPGNKKRARVIANNLGRVRQMLGESVT